MIIQGDNPIIFLIEINSILQRITSSLLIPLKLAPLCGKCITSHLSTTPFEYIEDEILMRERSNTNDEQGHLTPTIIEQLSHQLQLKVLHIVGKCGLQVV